MSKRVAIIIPCRNEERHIARCLDSVLNNGYDQSLMEVVVVDGMSDDRTRLVIADYASRFSCVRMIDNPRRIKPVALNLGIENTTAEYVVRIDAHAEYPVGYIAGLVNAVEESDADLSGARRITAPGNGSWGRVVTEAIDHPFAAGDASYRTATGSGYRFVDSVFCGCYRRSAFFRVGLFNEALLRTQDRELNKRIRDTGGRIVLDMRVTCTYFARTRFKDYAKWVYEGALWLFYARRFTETRMLSRRNLIPAAFLIYQLVLILSLVAAREFWPIQVFAALPLLVYAATGTLAAAQVARRVGSWSALPAAWLVFLITHEAYGAGSIVGWLQSHLLPRRLGPVRKLNSRPPEATQLSNAADRQPALRFPKPSSLAEPEAMDQSGLQRESLGPAELLDLTYYRGRVALYAILRALGVGEGDDVLTQAYTCVAVPEGIMAAGARPVFVDIEANGYSLDSADLARKITAQTRAVIVQHTFGIPADMDPIIDFAQQRGLAVIEDCCHTLTSRYRGRLVGTFGQASFYSFEYGKPVPIGAGGCAVANDPALRLKLWELYSKFSEPTSIAQWKLELQAYAYRRLYSPQLYWTLKTAFHRLSKAGLVTGNYHPIGGEPSAEFHWRMGRLARCRLRRALQQECAPPSKVHLYGDLFRELHVIQPQSRPGDHVDFVRYPVRVCNKQSVTRLAKEYNVEVADWYRTPIHPLSLEECRLVGYEPGCCPRAEQRAGEAISLPLKGTVTSRYLEQLKAVLGRAA